MQSAMLLQVNAEQTGVDWRRMSINLGWREERIRWCAGKLLDG